MFDIGGIEFLVVLIVALLVVGPKELPSLLRTLGKYAGMLKKQASEFRTQFDDVLKESEFSDIKKDFETMGEDAASEMRDVENSVSDGLEEFDDHSNLDDDDFSDIDEEFEALDGDKTKPEKSDKQASEADGAGDAETSADASEELASDASDSTGNDSGSGGSESAINGSSVGNGHDHAASASSESSGIERKSGT